MSVQVNDKVIFSKTAGQTIRIDGEDILILREEDIFGIIEE
jgi:chaperonin GroES